MPGRGTVNRAHVTRARSAIACCLLAGACGPPPPEATRFPLELHAASADGTRVAGARAWADGAELGATAATGALHAELRGRAGQAVTLTTACPPGFRTLEARRRIVLQRVSATSHSTTAAALALHIACEPTERSAILVVRARGPAPLAGMPIRSDDVVIGQTDRDGTAHMLLKVRPGTSLRIALDTSAWPALLPRDPVQRYELADEDSILLVDTSFTTRLAEPVRAARRAPKPREPHSERIPYRIR